MFIVDVIYSFNVVAKMKAFAKEHDVTVKFEEVKLFIKKQGEKLKQKTSFNLHFCPSTGLKPSLSAIGNRSVKRATISL